MKIEQTTTWFLLLTGLLLVGLSWGGEVGAEPPEAEAPDSASYTKAELAALDRALEAANLTRADLTFCKDLAKGHACFDVVKEMLRDPLTIAPYMDALVAETKHMDEKWQAPFGALLAVERQLHPDRRRPGLFEKHLDAVRRHKAGPETTPEGLLESLQGLDLSEGPVLCLTRDFEEEPGGEPLGILEKFKRGHELLGHEDVRYRILRSYLPDAMTWHEVFASPYSEASDAKLKKIVEAEGDEYVHALAARISIDWMLTTWFAVFMEPIARLAELPAAAFPKDKPLVKETSFGRIALGTMGDDVYTGEFAILIDPGGNDRYVGCRIGAAYGTENRRVGFFADLGGDDLYDCADVNITLGAAVLGVAAFLDLGAGNDRYRGGHASLGAAMGGVAVFYDDGGTDTYEGRTYTQGAAGFGIGIFQDDAVQEAPLITADEGTKDPVDIRLFDNDRLSAWANAQAFARCRGIALCINTRGNDTYEAGGVYLHAPLFADRYQSFSQGFAIGERGIDYAGGIALLIDHAGNDRYLGDIYNQGVGYWYSAGLLYDGGGNDLYEMTQYGQGSGIHLAVGGLVDEGGHDTYVMHAGLGQGGSHDYAASILHDRGGNDHYMGMTSCNGCGLTNSVGLHIDRSGNDTYAGREGSINSGRPARGSASVGVLVDLAGRDHYLGVMKDQSAWRHTDLGVGVDLEPDAGPGADPKDKPAADESAVEIPKICAYEGELTQSVFDDLWAIAIRWQVGENRHIVPKARARLVAFGKPVLPYLDRAMDKGASGLELRAYEEILSDLGEAGSAKEVAAFLRANLKHDSTRRKRVALWLAGEMKAIQLEGEVVALLTESDEGLDRRAAGVLQRLGSHAGNERLLAWLKTPDEELRVMAALGTLLGLDTDCYLAVRPLLDHPLISVRSRLATLLAGHHATYGKAVAAELEASETVERSTSNRFRRTVLDVLARTKTVLDEPTRLAVLGLLDDESWGIRADAARVLQSQLKHEDLPPEARSAVGQALAQRGAIEQDPYVLFWLKTR